VLVGVSRFTDPELYDLPSVTNNLGALSAILTDRDRWHLPPENCVVLGDEQGPVGARDIRAALREAARYAEDLLLVYYAGHGLPLDPGDLVLATTDTEPTSPTDRGLPIDDIREIFLENRARYRILVLDCCFSGRALEHMGLDKATATLTSVSATEPGQAPEGAEFTEFGEHLVNVLRRGIPGDRQMLSLRMIADEIRDRPGAARLARLQDSQGAADLLLVRNASRSRPYQPAVDLTKLAFVVQGIEAVATLVCRTIGPRGRANLVTGADGVVREVDTPVTVVEHFDPVRQPDEVGIGVGYIRDLVHVMHRRAGDGGATAVAIARALVAGVFAAMRDEDVPVNELIDGVERAFAVARAELDGMAEPVGSPEQLVSVARSSARDEEIGKLVADAVDRAAVSGAVLVEEGHQRESSLDFVPGLRVAAGSAGRAFHTDPVREEAKLDKPLVVVEDLTVANVRSAVADAKKAGTSLAIFAVAVDDDALAVAADEARAPDGPALLVVVLPPGDRGATAADRIRNLLGPNRKRTRTPRQVLATSEHTLLVWTASGAAGSEPDMDWLPVIRVSADSDTERQVLHRLTEAAVSSAFAAALDGGTVAGGGIALRDVARRLRDRADGRLGPPPERLEVRGGRLAGVRIAADALTAPARHMAENARLNDADLWHLLGAAPGTGTDLVGERVVDMAEAGIIDPVTVVRAAMAEALETVRRFVRLA
jgi:chaperonin GroEL (HSP60 family)